MKRILFVDDEPNVLQGLQRMLRSLRREWQMEFAEGGPKALDCLATSPFDVVLTDMRMPGMDGAELLGEIMRRYPGTVRIVLSGQCDRQTVLKCVGPAHQFLTKPCDSQILKSTLARACGLRDGLDNERYKCEVSRLTSVPTQPSIFAELVSELQSPQASIAAVADIVTRDVGITAKILQLVSSSFFGTSQRVSGPTEAVHLLGLDTIAPLVRSTQVIAPFNRVDVEGDWLQRLSDHSLAVGKAARAIAESETKDRVLIGDAFLAGFLHEIGTMALAQPYPGHREQRHPGETGTIRIDETHAGAGAYLMALWGLPGPIVSAIALQHFPGRSSDQSFTPLAALHVANAVANEDTTDPVGVSGTIDIDYLKRIGCANRLDGWRDICRKAKAKEVPQ